LNCPTCLSVMENRDERHHVEPDSYRMNLHCCNYDYDNHRSNCSCRAHMGVIVPPSYSNQEWICDHYNIPFIDNNHYYILRATPSTPTITYQNGLWKLQYLPNSKWTELLSDYPRPPIIRIPFVPLSTNNDMHEQAQYWFHKLKNLIAFS